MYEHRSFGYKPRVDLRSPVRTARRRLGVTGLVSVVALALIAGAAFLLDTRTGNRNAEALADYIGSAGVPPVDFIRDAGRSHRLLFLSDIEGAAEPKRLAAGVIEAMAKDGGLDAVVLEVPVTEQPWIDRYLNTAPEDASILLSRPRLVREHDSATRDYLEIFRQVWKMNQELGPGRSIRILAADHPDWPASSALAPSAAAALYARRDEFMAETVQRMLLGPYPRSRTLLFMEGYHTLNGGEASFAVGGADPIPVKWLAVRLAEDFPTEVYTVLVESTGSGNAYDLVAGYSNTAAFDIVRKGLENARPPLAVAIDEHFDFIRDPVLENAGPGIELDIGPRDYRLREIADAYVYLGAR